MAVKRCFVAPTATGACALFLSSPFFICRNDQVTQRPNLFFGRLNIVVTRLYRRIDVAQRARNLCDLERVMGIEPTLKAWQALVLPLNYTREFI